MLSVNILPNLLYHLARRLNHTEIAHTDEMKRATGVGRQPSPKALSTYRAAQARRVLSAAERYGVRLADKDVLDLGCNDGAITAQYVQARPRSLTGVDIDEEAIARAAADHPDVRFLPSGVRSLPLDDRSIDSILSFDVFEHVEDPVPLLRECRRILRPGGKLLIGTWGWGHPFAPHLWATMPVPYAHILFGERNMLRACRKVYHSEWYKPNMHDFDKQGSRYPDKYTERSISTCYLNKFWVTDFEDAFRRSRMRFRIHLEPFGSAQWTRFLLHVPVLREFLHSYLWAVLTK